MHLCQLKDHKNEPTIRGGRSQDGRSSRQYVTLTTTGGKRQMRTHTRRRGKQPFQNRTFAYLPHSRAQGVSVASKCRDLW